MDMSIVPEGNVYIAYEPICSQVGAKTDVALQQKPKDDNNDTAISDAIVVTFNGCFLAIGLLTALSGTI